jgi:pimeloyl-ACP methyl ester carboxylesterase
MPSISFSNGEIHYQIEGQGSRNLVLIHGFGEDSRIWTEFHPALVRAGMRVLMPDLPGFGKSDSLLPESLDHMADAVQACIREAKLENCILIGHSMGGYTALNLARRHPDLPLLGLGLFHSHPYADSPEKKENRSKTAEFIRKNGTPQFAQSFVPKMFAETYAAENPQLVKNLVENTSVYSEEAMAGALLAMRDRKDERETLAHLPVPALFMLGKKDQLADFESILPQVILPDTSQNHFLEQVGHMGMLEAKETCQQAVESFVEFCYTMRG